MFAQDTANLQRGRNYIMQTSYKTKYSPAVQNLQLTVQTHNSSSGDTVSIHRSGSHGISFGDTYRVVIKSTTKVISYDIKYSEVVVGLDLLLIIVLEETWNQMQVLPCKSERVNKHLTPSCCSARAVSTATAVQQIDHKTFDALAGIR